MNLIRKEIHPRTFSNIIFYNTLFRSNTTLMCDGVVYGQGSFCQGLSHISRQPTKALAVTTLFIHRDWMKVKLIVYLPNIFSLS